MAKEYTDLLTPIGRLVWGTPGKAWERKNEKTGEVSKEFSIGLAIPKQGEAHWNQTEWGAKIWNAGQSGYGAQTQHPMFSWKITDGDSAVPNRKGNVPNQQEGYPGHWILAFSTRVAPQLVNANGTQALPSPDAIKTGYYVQVFGSVADNRTAAGQPAETPGVYLNMQIVALAAFGPEIEGKASIDPRAVGFGGQLPPGASATPVAPASGGLMPQAAPVPAPAPVAVAPAVGFASPGAPAAPAPVRQMTAAATATYEAYIAAGWTDAQLIQNGLMVA
jgi:hypothetical protein